MTVLLAKIRELLTDKEGEATSTLTEAYKSQPYDRRGVNYGLTSYTRKSISREEEGRQSEGSCISNSTFERWQLQDEVVQARY